MAVGLCLGGVVIETDAGIESVDGVQDLIAQVAELLAIQQLLSLLRVFEIESDVRKMAQFTDHLEIWLDDELGFDDLDLFLGLLFLLHRFNDLLRLCLQLRLGLLVLAFFLLALSGFLLLLLAIFFQRLPVKLENLFELLDLLVDFILLLDFLFLLFVEFLVFFQLFQGLYFFELFIEIPDFLLNQFREGILLLFLQRDLLLVLGFFAHGAHLLLN